jgi:two-component system CheB/CheR fusion protein
MPRSAIDSGCVDFVLPPKGIAQELVRIGRHPYIARATPDSEIPTATGAGGEKVDTLLGMLRQVTGVDFAEYKQSTLQRRIKRRMVLHRLENLEDYLAYIKDNPNEMDELYRDVLINVTGFFRDPEAFEALRNVVFPTLLQDRPSEAGPLRFWVSGCSTGEEAYSIARFSRNICGTTLASLPRPPRRFKYSPPTSVTPLSTALASACIRKPPSPTSRRNV